MAKSSREMDELPSASVTRWSWPLRLRPVRAPGSSSAGGLTYVQSTSFAARTTSNCSLQANAIGRRSSGKPGESTSSTSVPGTIRLAAPPTRISRTPLARRPITRPLAASTSSPSLPGRGRVALITTSCPALRRATSSGLAASPRTGPERPTAVTWWPRATASWTTRLPTAPPAPHTRIRMSPLPSRNEDRSLGGRSRPDPPAYLSRHEGCQHDECADRLPNRQVLVQHQPAERRRHHRTEQSEEGDIGRRELP